MATATTTVTARLTARRSITENSPGRRARMPYIVDACGKGVMFSEPCDRRAPLCRGGLPACAIYTCSPLVWTEAVLLFSHRSMRHAVTRDVTQESLHRRGPGGADCLGAWGRARWCACVPGGAARAWGHLLENGPGGLATRPCPTAFEQAYNAPSRARAGGRLYTRLPCRGGGSRTGQRGGGGGRCGVAGRALAPSHHPDAHSHRAERALHVKREEHALVGRRRRGDHLGKLLFARLEQRAVPGLVLRDLHGLAHLRCGSSGQGEAPEASSGAGQGSGQRWGVGGREGGVEAAAAQRALPHLGVGGSLLGTALRGRGEATEESLAHV